jgi:hypothetical protein
LKVSRSTSFQVEALGDALGVDVQVVRGALIRGDVAGARRVPRGRVAHDVVRVDERDDEGERLRGARVGALEEGGGLGGGEPVPVGDAAAEEGRRLVAAGVRRKPPFEAVVLEVVPALDEQRAAGILAHVPLAAVLHVVAGRDEEVGHVLAGGLQRVLGDDVRVGAGLEHLLDVVLGGIHAGEDGGTAR